MAAPLTAIARQAIGATLGLALVPDRTALLHTYPELSTKQACFVTLTLDGALRGCIGSLSPYRLLVDDLIGNANAAAFEDPRFLPLSAAEFEQVLVEVSLLSIPKPLQYDNVKELHQKIRPGIDGVILSLGDHRATFLPQVWEQLRDFDTFFSHLCMKAGLNADALSQHPQISTYQVEMMKEDA